MAASEAQVLFLPLGSLVVTLRATLNLRSWNSIKSPWAGSHWPGWSCVRLGANHVVAQRWGRADWLACGTRPSGVVGRLTREHVGRRWRWEPLQCWGTLRAGYWGLRGGVLGLAIRMCLLVPI